MKKILIGTTLAVFALAPALSWADCSDAHDKASMASLQAAEKAQAPAASKVPSPVVAKISATKDLKQAVAKPASPSKTDGSTVVAKNN